MNTMKTLMIAATMATISTSAFAAEKIERADPSLEKIATISVLGASSPNELDQKLAQKADALGATKYRIIMNSSNDNSERGTAEIYK